MRFSQLIQRMVKAAERGDGAGVVRCFVPDGIYHDVFYGSFPGAAIADMIENYFHRDGAKFKWDLHDAIESDGIGYARYVFSYESKLDGFAGRRAIFEGVACCRLCDGLIADYREVANAAVGLHSIGFAPGRVAKFVAKQSDELMSREEATAHLAG